MARFTFSWYSFFCTNQENLLQNCLYDSSLFHMDIFFEKITCKTRNTAIVSDKTNMLFIIWTSINHLKELLWVISKIVDAFIFNDMFWIDIDHRAEQSASLTSTNSRTTQNIVNILESFIMFFKITNTFETSLFCERTIKIIHS